MLSLAAPYAAKAQGIEDISDVSTLIANVVAIAQANIASALNVSQANPATVAILDLNTADSDPIDIINNLPIVTLAPGEDGINGQSLATAIVAVDVEVSQSNSNDLSQSDPDELDQDQEVEQENENELDAFVDNAAFADTVSVDNAANIAADGNGVNALSQGVANVTVDNSVVQTNFNRLIGSAPEELDQDQDVDQDNVNDTDIEVLNQASAADVSVSNIGTTIAGLNGVNAASDADAETTIIDTVSQTNSNELVGTSSDLDQDQDVEQENENDQDAVAETTATSGHVGVFESGTLIAGGDGIDASSKADADTEIDQTATQSNSNTSTATLSLDAEDAEEAGEFEAEAELEQEQEVDQSNDSEQEADASASASYVGDGDAVSVFQSGILNALGDGIDASSEAEAEADIDQTATQSNDNRQSVTFAPNPFTLNNTPPNNPELEVDVDVDQDQEDIDQTNDADQHAEASAEAYSGNVSVTQDIFSSITAVGTGIEAESSADATADIDQTITQTNTNTQTATTNLTVTAATPFVNHAVEPLAGDAALEAQLEPEVELEQEQEDIEQTNEAEQTGLEYPIYAADGVTVIGWENGPALAEAEAISGAVSVVQPVTSFLTAGDFLTGSGDGIDAASVADADAELAQEAVQDNINRQTATTNLAFVAAPSFAGVHVDSEDGDAELAAGIEDAEVSLEQEQEDIDQSNEAEQNAVADADAGYVGVGYAVSVVQDGTLVAADTGIDAEAKAEAEADLEQVADQGNENTQSATPTVAFTARPTFRRGTLEDEGVDGAGDAELAAGIEDVEVEVEQEQEDIEQENEAEQDGAAYATADYSGDVYVLQSGSLSAGNSLLSVGGDGIEAASVAEADADLDQTAIQSNLNRQDIISLFPATTTFAFTSTPRLDDFSVEAGGTDGADQVGSGELDTGIEDVEVSLEQEQEDIDQDNSADQDGVAEAEAYAGDVFVEQTGGLFAVEDGVDATSAADANAELEQKADQDNLNAQSAATTLAFDASPTFGTATGSANADNSGNPPEPSVSASGGVAVAAVDDAEIDAGIDDVEVSVEQDQEEIEQENEAEQEGEVDADAYSGDVTVNVGLDEVPVDPVAGDTGVDAASEADANADLEQLADQSNINRQEITLPATTTAIFSAAATLNTVAAAAGNGDDAEIGAGIEDVDVSVDQDQEDIDQTNDADQSGETYAEAYSGYVDVLQRSGDLLTAGDTGIEAASKAEAEADLDQTALQRNENTQTATTYLTFAANPTFGTTTGSADADADTDAADVAAIAGVAVGAARDVEIDAGIDDVEVSVEQEQEDIDQSNEAEQRGLYYGDEQTGYYGPAYASAEAYSGAVYVEQTGALFAGTVTFDPVTDLPIDASGDGIDAASVADADAELQQRAVQDNVNSQTAITNLAFTASPKFYTVGVGAGHDAEIDAGIEEVEVDLSQEQEDIDQSNDADQYAEADADAGYEGDDFAVSVVQSGTLEAADTGIDAEARAEAKADLEQIADQGNDNRQTATPTVAFTAAPIFGNTNTSSSAEASEGR